MRDKISMRRFAVVCGLSLVFAVAAMGQFPISITIPKPTPKPTPTSTRPTTINTRPAETGATRDQVSEFNKDIAPYREGMNSLKWWSTATDSVRAGCGELNSLKRALTEGAAFYEIVKQKWAGIENPSWSTVNAESNMVGDYRRAAENREAIVKRCVNGLMDARLISEIAGVDSLIAEFDKNEGYVLRRDFDDKPSRYRELMDKWKEHYALVGVTSPDPSVFAKLDERLDALLALANKNAAKWVFPPTFRDAAIETRARGWLKAADPKAIVVAIGMLHGEWQVNKAPNGLPSGRYKRGYVMFRKPGFANCLVNSFSMEQNYIGGGRFNAEAITSGMAHTLRVQTCK
jgi:hypothetical protein